ncbi:MFS transporter [Marinicrinis sediminis]|uniref:MFS transporter n=1 Tax=Marinicrinis sediminis TaxID=1652465 RepID=A0ABW5R8A9_9BACL
MSTGSKPKQLPFLFVHHAPHGEAKEPSKRAEQSFDRQAILLLTVQGLYAAATALSILFVNVFIWKISKNYALIGWFALTQHVCGTLTFFLAGKWVKQWNKMNVLRAGIALSALQYLTILLLGQQAARYALLIGALQGISAGFFWLAFNVVYFEITNPGNRDRFNGWAGLLGSTAGMIAPWVSGVLISRLGDRGYTVIFSASLAIFILGVAISFFLKKREAQGQYEWFYAFRQLSSSRSPWRPAFMGLFFQGIREGVFMFLVGLLVYIVTKDEFRLGTYSFITSAVALGSFWLIGKLIKPVSRNTYLLLGTVALSLVMTPLWVEMNYAMLLVFGIGTAIFFPMYIIPITSSVFDLIGRDEQAVAHRVEYVVLREAGLNAGRVAGTILYIGFVVWIGTEKHIPFIVFLLLIGSSPIFSWFFIRRLSRYLQQGKNTAN